jgi:polar amino acid transport system substrate-binding protein
MTRPTRRRVTSAPLAAVLALAVGLLTSSCGEATTPEDSASSRQPQVDRTLRDRLPQSVLDRGVLRVGTDASYAPMSSFGPDGRTIVGVEPDLGAEIGRVLGVKVRFVQTDFTKLLSKVAHGRLDLAMSAMTDTAPRARQDDFVDYFSAGTSIVVQRGNPAGVTDIGDLCGKVVAVEQGTTQVDLLGRAQKHCAGSSIDVETFPTNSDALVQLRTGRAVAVLNDLPPAEFLVNDSRTRSDYQLASTTQYEPGLYGVVVGKDQPGLRDAVRGAFEELSRNGDYAHVLASWHVSDGAVDRISVDVGRGPRRFGGFSYSVRCDRAPRGARAAERGHVRHLHLGAAPSGRGGAGLREGDRRPDRLPGPAAAVAARPGARNVRVRVPRRGPGLGTDRRGAADRGQRHRLGRARSCSDQP